MLTVARQNALVRTIKSAIEVADMDRPTYQAIQRALTLQMKGEREHRAMGKRFTRGACGYKTSVQTAAYMWFAREFFAESKLIAPTVLDLAHMREDHQQVHFARALAIQASYNADLSIYGAMVNRLCGHVPGSNLPLDTISLQEVRTYDYSEDCAK